MLAIIGLIGKSLSLIALALLTSPHFPQHLILTTHLSLAVPDFIHLPAEAFSHTLPTEAFFAVPKGGLAQIFLFCGVCELIGHRGRVTYEDFDGSRVPGDVGFNPFNVKYDESMRLKEIKNGRLAILACSGLLHQIMIYKIGVVAALSGLPTYPL